MYEAKDNPEEFYEDPDYIAHIEKNHTLQESDLDNWTKYAVVGIDPGFSGALCFWEIGKVNIELVKMPVNKIKKTKQELDIFRLKNLLVGWQETHHIKIYLENVHAMPKQGVASMFTFGKNYGMLLGLIECLDISYVLVSPTTWVSKLGLKGSIIGGRFDKLVKEHRIARESLLTKTGKYDDGKIDAALIALYGIKEEANKWTRL